MHLFYEIAPNQYDIVAFYPTNFRLLGQEFFLRKWGRENLLLKLHDLYHSDKHSGEKKYNELANKGLIIITQYWICTAVFN